MLTLGVLIIVLIVALLPVCAQSWKQFFISTSWFIAGQLLLIGCFYYEIKLEQADSPGLIIAGAIVLLPSLLFAASLLVRIILQGLKILYLSFNK